MSETELGNMTVASPSTLSLTSISSAFVNRVSKLLTFLVRQIVTNTGTAISGQLAEGAKRCWEEVYWKSLVVSKIAKRLLIPSNCEFVRVPKLHEAVA